MGVKFLHCGDTHLGCTPNGYEERFLDFFKSFEELVERASMENCKYILISGDILHLKVVNSKTLLNVTRVFKEAIDKGIKIIAIEGNHDKAFYVDEYSWLEYLNERGYITLLKHKLINNELVLDNDSIYEDDQIRIIGIGYLGGSTSEYIKDLNEKITNSDKFTVLMLHAAVNRLCGQEMADVKLEELLPLREKVDYLALGHIHYRYEYEDFIYNPGSLENIRLSDAKKSDDKGYYIVNVEGKEKQVTYYQSLQRKVKFYDIKFNISEDIDTVIDKIINYDYDIESKAILYIKLYGQVKFNPYLLEIDTIKNKLITKYDLLEVEIDNFINIIDAEINETQNSDLKSIEKEAIAKYLEQNVTNIKDDERTNVVLEIQNLKSAIINNMDEDIIIKNMLKDGDE